ncbi:cob(I)yrinic acid a,c-diamide adenosyltransferase [Corynebacterium callunae]|uniref:cob(I)yrinic acid a,c-diamide adenosyltransferase n=1 Tax=Corynebacterium callunae TaxID=1721 RepID=UPI003982567F
MAVHLTKIYTRTGDDGTTGLADFSRVPKDDPRLIAYAETDEANCAIGMVLALGNPPEAMAQLLLAIQNDLFDVGADLATPIVENPQYPPLRVKAEYIDLLEAECDKWNADLAALDSFILPGGTPAAALLHNARAITRRAERAAWVAHREFPESTSPQPGKYLNRLSDLLFILSRAANASTGDIKWVPGGQHQKMPLHSD